MFWVFFYVLMFFHGWTLRFGSRFKGGPSDYRFLVVLFLFNNLYLPGVPGYYFIDA